ncbi:DUF1120 domain-containing protein [Trinickia terrae]|uniref:DUF1120 domain-containing protein n=1 Tax=Trinickia terrae TaxID=2571161 RepID=A0A4U1IBC3_9BURK|nr:DUF1120 domain-containing protein [Trinickia terrae]TKC90883.1 DUF1120 domain-containing protein [Trinickia terrae]
MKQTKLVKALAAATLGGALLVAGASAFAADTADLSVKGTIIPSACVPSFSGGGVADFGTIKTADLTANDYTKIGTKSVTLTVTCSTNKNVGFNVMDNSAASSLGADVLAALGTGSANNVYGLGSTTINGNAVKLGSYVLTVDSKPTVDGASYLFGWVVPGSGTTYNTSTARFIDGTGKIGYAATQADSYGVAGKVFVFPITVTAAINKGSALPLTGDVSLNGQATFNVNYW